MELETTSLVSTNNSDEIARSFPSPAKLWFVDTAISC